MIFDEQVARKPDLYPWTQEFIKAMHQGFWTSEEFSFSSDIQHFKTELTIKEREIIKRALSAIGQVEISVKKFWLKLGDNLPHPSLLDLGCVMANVEVIHNLAYERLLVVLGLSDIFEENLKLDIIKGRVKYLKKYLDKSYENSKKQYIYALILFTLFVENVSLFSQFYIVLWFNRYKNLLKDTAQQVQYTSKEETIHALVGIKLINTIKEEYPEFFDKELEKKVLHEAQEAFNCESKIIDWMVGNFHEENLNSNILKEYVKNRINDSLKEIGFNIIFEINQELLLKTRWMDEEILANSMTDFFHKKPIEYSKNSQNFDAKDLF